MTTDWPQIMAEPDWRIRNRQIEEALRRFLDELHPAAAPLGTRDMLERLLPQDGVLDASDRERAVKQVMNIAWNASSLRDVVREVATRGFNTGKEVNRYQWSYRPYTPAPAPGRPAPGRPEAASSGRASKGTSSLADLRDDLRAVTARVEALEAAMNQPPLMGEN